MKNGQIESVKYSGQGGRLLSHDDHKTWIANPDPRHDQIVKDWWGVVSLYSICVDECNLDRAIGFWQKAVAYWNRMTVAQREQANCYLEEKKSVLKEL